MTILQRLGIARMAVLIVLAGGVAAAALAATQLSFADPGGSSSFQRQILKDGVVDHSEYLASVSATRDCVAAAGIEVGEIREIGGTIDFEYGGADTFEGAQGQHAVFSDCFEQFAQDVQYAWTVQNGPDTSEMDAKREAFAACLAERGYDLPVRPSNEQFTAVSQIAGDDFITCARQFMDERGILEF